MYCEDPWGFVYFLLGKGIRCCATYDGARYRGKEIAVACTAPELEEEINDLNRWKGRAER